MHKCVQGGTRAGAFVDCRECQSRVAILEVQVDEAGSRLREAQAKLTRVEALVERWDAGDFDDGLSASDMLGSASKEHERLFGVRKGKQRANGRDRDNRVFTAAV